MFPSYPWTSEWLHRHCWQRFNVTPQPTTLAQLWGFDSTNLARSTSRILFVNGLNDGWSVGGILHSLSVELLGSLSKFWNIIKNPSNITEGYKWINTISAKGAWIVTKWACEVWTGSKFWELLFAELCFPVSFWCFILVTFRAQKVASVNFFRRGLIAINLPNGAHHSELSHSIQDDTPDVKEAHERILGLVGQWLEEIRNPGGLTIVSWCKHKSMDQGTVAKDTEVGCGPGM